MAGSTACSLEELMAAEISNSSEGHRYESFLQFLLENIYFLVPHLSFPEEKDLTLRWGFC